MGIVLKVYIQNSTTLESLREKSFNSEDEIRSLIESDLPSFLSYKFVMSEFCIKNFRIDTLAFDPRTKSFVIIEYKKTSRRSLIDQGFAYLSVMLRNMDSFTLMYNTALNESLKTSSINWSDSKVVFISQSYTRYQKNLACFDDLPIELYTIKRYERDIITLERFAVPEILSLKNMRGRKPAEQRKRKKDKSNKEYPVKSVPGKEKKKKREEFDQVGGSVFDIAKEVKIKKLTTETPSPNGSAWGSRF